MIYVLFKLSPSLWSIDRKISKRIFKLSPHQIFKSNFKNLWSFSMLLLKVLLAGFAWYSYWFLLKRYTSQTYKGLKLEFPIVRYLQYMPLPKHCFQLRCGFYGDVLCFLHNSFERMDNLCHDCSFTRSLWCRIAGVGFLIENLMIKQKLIWVKEKLRGKGIDFWFLRCLGLFSHNIFGWRGMLTIMLNAVEWDLYFQFVAEYEFCWSVCVSLAVGVCG